MTPQLAPTPRTTLRRGAARGRNERAEIDAILDEAYIAHVGFVVDGEPRVLPMAYGRDGDSMYLPGAADNAHLDASGDDEVSVTRTLLSGLRTALSASHTPPHHP